MDLAKATLREVFQQAPHACIISARAMEHMHASSQCVPRSTCMHHLSACHGACMHHLSACHGVCIPPPNLLDEAKSCPRRNCILVGIKKSPALSEHCVCDPTRVLHAPLLLSSPVIDETLPRGFSRCSCMSQASSEWPSPLTCCCLFLFKNTKSLFTFFSRNLFVFFQERGQSVHSCFSPHPPSLCSPSWAQGPCPFPCLDPPPTSLRWAWVLQCEL